MQSINFTKLEALGNDFVLIDISNNTNLEFTSTQIKQLCDRKYGVGCDQLLIIHKQANTINPRFSYAIYNNDGSMAMHCGNGARAVIKYIKLNYVLNSSQIELETPAKNIVIGEIIANQQIKLDMGVVQFTPNSLPARLIQNDTNNYFINYHEQIINYSIAAIGNPHAIIIINNEKLFEDNDYITKLGMFIQAQVDIFPEGVNVNFVYIKNPSLINLKTYERGSGLTNACGTGATASATYCHYYQNCSENIQVCMTGGNLQINIASTATQMIGDANIVFNGCIAL